MTERPDFDKMSCPVPLMDHDSIQLAHGAGGLLSSELIDKLIIPRFASPELNKLEDQAVLDLPAGRLAFSTDTFVVSPIFFPGGDIGDLAINGTVNDVAMSGAIVHALSVGFVLEEGLPLADFHRVLCSMETAAKKSGVRIVTGDTKVVGNGSCDKIFINTSGVGVIPEGIDLSAGSLEPGDAVVLFTDGIYEVAGAGQEEFGEQRLLAAAQRHEELSLRDLFPALLNEACQFASEGAFDDDVCLVGFRLRELLKV